MASSPSMPMADVRVVVWPADKHLEESVGGQVFQESMSVLNATHLIAILENRLQRGRNIPIRIGKVEYFDDAMEKWLLLVAEHDLAKFEQPIKLRVWSRRRLFTCKVYPLHTSASSFAPRRVSFYALNLEEFSEELRRQLPETERGFRDIVYEDPQIGWILLEDPSQIPSDLQFVNLKIIPTEQSAAEIVPDLATPSHQLGQQRMPAEMSRLQHVIDLEKHRGSLGGSQGAKRRAPVPKRESRIPMQLLTMNDGSIEMPGRIGVRPLSHTAAEVRQLHSEKIRAAFESLSENQLAAEGVRKTEPDPNRDHCCYPGSGQVYSVDSSGHGDLKREVIAYTRMLLQDPESPVQEFLPAGGLKTHDLVNVVSLVSHYFMVQSHVRPAQHLNGHDKATIHAILADVLDELWPGKALRGTTPGEERERDDEMRSRRAYFTLRAQNAAGAADYAQLSSEQPPDTEPPTPDVVLARPVLGPEGELIFYGTVTHPYQVTCRWSMCIVPGGVEIDVDREFFATGFAVTEPISSSSFAMKLLPHKLHKAVEYKLSLNVMSDITGGSSTASQRFHLPR